MSCRIHNSPTLYLRRENIPRSPVLFGGPLSRQRDGFVCSRVVSIQRNETRKPEEISRLNVLRIVLIPPKATRAAAFHSKHCWKTQKHLRGFRAYDRDKTCGRQNHNHKPIMKKRRGPIQPCRNSLTESFQNNWKNAGKSIRRAGESSDTVEIPVLVHPPGELIIDGSIICAIT